MTESRVVGRRLGFWKGTSPFWLVFTFVVCPLCVILGVRYLVGLRHVDHLFDNFGDYLLPSALAAVGILMGPVGLVTLQSLRRAYVIESACPACGFEASRDYGAADRKNPWPVACRHCLAYLRVHPTKLVVREVPRNEPSDHLFQFGLIEEQYVGIVPRRDKEDRPFAFAMPTICAICSAPDAPFLTEIGYCGATSDSKGALRGVLYPMNYVGKATPTKHDDLDNANRHIKTPACAQHKDKIAMERDSGFLQFASYRYYREFCALNKITEGPDVAFARAHSEVPQAVARVAPADDSKDRSASA